MGASLISFLSVQSAMPGWVERGRTKREPGSRVDLLREVYHPPQGFGREIGDPDPD